MKRLVLSGAVEFAGVAAIVWGFGQLAPWLGWVVGGVALVVTGLAIDPPRGRRE